MTEDDRDEIPEPRENPHLEGHDAAERVLLDACEGGRMAHAWLLSGPRGVGKATLAYRFARFVLANGDTAASNGGDLFAGEPPSPSDSPSGLHLAPDHPVFRRVAAGGHADLLTIERSLDDKGRLRSEIVVDDVRKTGQLFGMTAGEGGWRVAIIDAADDMNRNAANALLKVLEEPPARALLLLVSHNPGRLLPTIRSRCRKLTLRPLPDATVAALVRRYAPDQGAGDAAALAALAGGSPGRALALVAEGGLDLYRDLTGLLDTLPGLDVPALHAFGDRLGRRGAEEAFGTVAGLLRWWLGRLIVFRAEGGAEDALMARLGTAAGLDRWLEVWEKINRLLAGGERANLDRKQVVLNVFLAIEDAVRP